MKNKIFKIILVSALLLAANQVKASGYHYYVDANGAEALENGTSQYPWKTIGAAMNFVNDHKLNKRSIYIKNGEYKEYAVLRRDTKLYGESKGDVVIKADGHQNAVKIISTTSGLKNLTMKNAEATNIIINKRSKATIKNCKIEEAGKYGIEVKDSSSAQKYKSTIKNSEVQDSGSQGLYIARRRISIANNEIFDNDEEGIDLHQGMRGSVFGNNIHGNGESGIESILSSSKFTIKGNSVNNNHAQGITVQVYSTNSKGKINITRNTIQGNDDYGICYANYTGKLGPNKFKVFCG